MTDKDVIDTLNNVLSKVAKLEEGFDAKLLEISELKKEINHLKECNIADTKSIAELEKRINDSLLLPTIITHGRDHTTLTTQIAELKEQLNNYSVNIFHRNDINLNREVLRELKQNMISPILYGLWRKEIFFTNEYQEIYNNGLEIEHKLSGGEKSEGDMERHTPSRKTGLQPLPEDSKPPYAWQTGRWHGKGWIKNVLLKDEKPPEAGSARQTDWMRWLYMEAGFNCLENFRITLKDDILVAKEDLEHLIRCHYDDDFRRRMKEKYLGGEKE